MKQAVCFSCGEVKPGALARCPHCGKLPESDEDLLLSLALSSRYLGGVSLEVAGRDIKEGRRPRLDEQTLERLQAQLEEFKGRPVVRR